MSTGPLYYLWQRKRCNVVKPVYSSTMLDNHNYHVLSYDVASGIEIRPCNKIDKPLVAYKFLENVME